MTRLATPRPLLLAGFGGLLLAAVVPPAAAAQALPVAGRVMAEDGSPVAAGTVELRSLASGELEPPSTEGVVEAGRFVITAPAPGMWRLTVRAEGWVPASISLEPLLEPTVLPPARLPADLGGEATVTDPSNRPIASAEVRASSVDVGAWPGSADGPFGSRWQPAARAGLTGDDGRVRLPRAADERLVLTARAPGRALARASIAEPWRVVLPPSSGEAFLVREPSGEPVTGVRLRVLPGDWRIGPSDATGKLPPLTLRGDLRPHLVFRDGRRQPAPLAHRRNMPGTTLQMPGTAPEASDNAPIEENQSRESPSEIRENESERAPGGTASRTPGTASRTPGSASRTPGTATVPLASLPQAPIRGRLVSALDASPIGGAWVWRPERAEQAVRSDVDGRFLLHAEPGEIVAGSSLRLLLAAPGYLRRNAVPSLPEADEGSEADPTLTLWPAAAVSGRVVNADGLPRADVALHAPRRLTGPGHSRGPSTYTDAEGRFHAGGLEPGKEIELDLVRKDLRHLVYPVAPLQPFELRRGLHLVMDAAALVVGRVVDSEGRPLPEATVELDGSAQRRDGDVRPAEVGGDDEAHEVSTGRDGRFAATLTREGLLDLEVRRPGFAPLRLEAIPASSAEDRIDLGDLPLERASPLFGVVKDTEGEPVVDAEIYAFSRAFERWEELDLYLRFRRPEARTGADGRFSLEGLHAGESLDLVVRRRGFARAVVPGVAAPTEEPLEVVLEPAARVEGRVVDTRGEGVARAEVFLRRPFALEVSGRAEARTADDGTFLLRDVALGAAELWARFDGYMPARRTLDITGDMDGIRLELPFGFVIAGVVVSPDGLPVRGAALRLRRPDGAGYGDRLEGVPGTETGVDGRFRLEGIAPGDWRLGVSREGFDIERNLQVQGDLELEIVLDDPGEPLVGVVIDRGGQGIEGVRLQLVREGGGRDITTVSREGGAFRFPRVDAGRWRLRTAFSPRKVGVPVALLEDPGAIPVDGDPETPEPELEIRVSMGATLFGRVAGLAPHELPRVQVSARGETSIVGRGRVGVDAAGRFEIGRLAVGRWQVRAALPGTGRSATGDVTLLPDQSEARLELEFGTGLRLDGQLVAESEPLPNVVLVAVDALGLETRIRTDLEGRFLFTGLDPGPLTLRIVVEGSRSIDRRLELDTDRSIVIDLLE